MPRRRPRSSPAWRSIRQESSWLPSATTIWCGFSTPQSGKILHRWKSHTDWVKASVFRPDGRVLATSGADRRIHLWDMASQGRPHTLSELDQVVYTLAYSPDGRMLAAAGFDDKVRIFDANEGRLLRELAAPGSDIRAICFSPDGTRLAAAGRAGLVRIWQSDTGQLVADVQVSARRVCALAYSPDGKFLAVGGQQRVGAAVGCVVGQARGRSAGAAGRSAVALFLRARPAGLRRQRQRDSSLEPVHAAGAMPAGRAHRLGHHDGLPSRCGNADFRQLRHDGPPVGREESESGESNAAITARDE